MDDLKENQPIQTKIDLGWVNDPSNMSDGGVRPKDVGDRIIRTYQTGWTVEYQAGAADYAVCGVRHAAVDHGRCGIDVGHLETPHAWTHDNLRIVRVHKRVRSDNMRVFESR